ncbi:TrkA family potassium uptake protein [Dermabacteraceae bacterium TAE3-ERU27]|nr:TrkA family potassium uptake protein [Dermabacteraceae bacterium TAE3-ERU27]
MHFVIMGCGRVGASLALNIQEMGHTVAVIDRDPHAFRRLGDSFAGTTVTGMGFDRDTLKAARIEEAYAFAAVSSGDNSNILSARVARETFGVKHVVARIYDPRRAQVYERLGIATVASVRWVAGQVFKRMIPGSPSREFQDVSGLLSMVEIECDPSWVGTTIRRIEGIARCRVTHLHRLGDGYLPSENDLLQEGDLLHVMVETERMDEVEVLLTHRKQAPAE